MIGSFCLYRLEHEKQFIHGINLLEKTFQNSKSFNLGEFRFKIFSDKNIDSQKNFDFWMFGTLLYKGKKDEDAADLIFKQQTINWDEVFGNYLIIRKNVNGIQFILDPLRKYHLFSLENESFISNSFLSCCEAAQKLTIDRLAVYEKLGRGYIIRPNTLFKEIRFLGNNDRLTSNFSLYDNAFKRQRDNEFSSRKEAILFQQKCLINYFEENSNTFEEEGLDLGISSGYDSRLLLSLMKKVDLKNVQLHTHAIKGLAVHEFDKSIVRKLSQVSGYLLKIVETSKFSSLYGQELDKSILENFNTFQGRNCHNMGAFTETYTLSYKKEVLDNFNISLNGLGGEVYRNYYNISEKFSLKYFLENSLFYRFSNSFFGRKIFDDLQSDFLTNVESQIGFSFQKRPRNWVRTYYNEIRMPQGDASNHNAFNPHIRFITPFIEPSVINSAVGIEKYIGHGGEFEGELIWSINNELALIPTHYGKSALNPGLKLATLNLLKYLMPQAVTRKKFDLQYLMYGTPKSNVEFIDHIQNESTFFGNAWQNLKGYFPELNWEYVYFEFACMVNAAMLAVTIETYKYKLQE